MQLQSRIMPDADPRLDAWRQLLTAHAEVVDVLERELREARGLPLSWYDVLLQLHESGEGRMRMHELAESLLLSRSAATRFVDRMQKAGLVTREACKADRRGTFVVMTDEGRAAFRAAAPVHLEGIRRHFSAHLDEEEARILAGVLQRVADAARATGTIGGPC
jgi:DNA-binding MarR family transcriptional regulator